MDSLLISFKKNWFVVGTYICKFVMDIINFILPLEGVNNNFITLIPKVKNSKKIRDFIPISLCNVIYKTIAKTLANRLKHILLDIISPQQSAFVLGRLIIDNILISYEVLHSLSTKLKDKERFMTLKLDISKTYDRIE